jgi:hypothetical protein
MVMAVSLAVMAIIQIALIVVVIRLVQKMTGSVEQLRQDVRPVLEQATRAAEDARKVSALAVVYAERIDELLATTTRRVDATLGIVQGLMNGPVRQGTAVVSAFGAVLSMFQLWQQRKSARENEEEPLFVG